MGSLPQQRLYILDTGISHPQKHGAILSCRPDGSDLRTVVAALPHKPDGIAIDARRGRMYWSNMGASLTEDGGSLESAALDGGDRRVLVPHGVVGTFTPKQVALAPRAGQLYWCDREGMKVMRCNAADGSGVEVLVSTGAGAADRADVRRHCVGVAVDEARGHVYWSQKGPAKGQQGRIFRTALAPPPGSTPEDRPRELVAAGLPEPIDLELDERSQTLYWTDRGDPPRGNTLNRLALAPGPAAAAAAEPEILARRLHEAIGLAVDFARDVAYVTDLAGGVYAVDINTQKKTTLFPELGDLTGIALA